MRKFLSKLKRIGSIHGFAHACVLIGKQSHGQNVLAQDKSEPYVDWRKEDPPEAPTCNEDINLVFVWVVRYIDDVFFEELLDTGHAAGFENHQDCEPQHEKVFYQNSEKVKR